ncbi:filamentous haemagglutinin family protein [Methylomonas paludis]|nr:filamentous haemagglutinin family protein [Methylomonas paludis]
MFPSPISQPKPLVLAIRALIASGVMAGAGITAARAELPIPESQVGVTLDHATASNPAHIGTGVTAWESANQHTLNIDEAKDYKSATVDWSSFNISAGDKVAINQEAGNSAILINNIHDSNASNILGSLTANGQVYLINENGFLFGKDSQVNVNSLVASTLGLTAESLQYGIAGAYNSGNGAASLSGNGQIYLHDANGNVVLGSDNKPVSIKITLDGDSSSHRAKITTASGGLVLLAAPTIINKGDIESPNGQTILAAATDKVYLQQAGSSSDIRGFLVEVGTGGTVTNDSIGKILAETGNVSIMGFAVNQDGIASATTSVLLNGSVRLLAREGVNSFNSATPLLTGKTTVRSDVSGIAAIEGIDPSQVATSAKVILGTHSTTSVDLVSDKTTTALAAQSQPQSSIEISGHEVNLLSGSLVQAHSGNVAINAFEDPQAPTTQGTGRVYLETGSTVDVSGIKNVAEAMSRNIVSLKLQSNELRDAPLQRKGILFGKTVQVDVRDATLSYDSSGNLLSASVPIADITGAVQRIAENIDERSTTAGTINLTSTGDVIVKSGSTLDVSGGSLAYQAGYIQTTGLVSNGSIFDIGTAPANRSYSSIITLNTYQAGYVEGKAGGTVNITGYAALLDGTLKGQVIAGDLQRQSADWAAGSSLNINLVPDGSHGQQNVVFSTSDSGRTLGAADALPTDANGNPVALNLNVNNLHNAGLLNTSIKTGGSLTLFQDTKLQLAPGGKLNINAETSNILGSIVIPSGTVSIKPLTNDTASAITLGSSALIDVSGWWVNDAQDIQSGNALSPVAITGGSVNLVSEQANLNLKTGSKIDVSGGGWLQTNGNLTQGSAGSISLIANSHVTNIAANLLLNGELDAWGLAQNGSLTLASSEVLIGNSSDAAKAASNPQALVLDPGILAQGGFQKGGFSSYNITANQYAPQVLKNTELDLGQVLRQLSPTASQTATGSHLTDLTSTPDLSNYIYKPVNFTLTYAETADQKAQEALKIGEGAKLNELAAGGNITLNSDIAIWVDGSVIAPAGNINLNITTPTGSTDAGYLASQYIWLGANSQLLAGGVFVPQYTSNGLTTGDVKAGGSVSLTANRGYIVTNKGSLIDVSGTSKTLDFLETGKHGTHVISRNIASSGGSISLAAAEGILADGGFAAKSGGNGAAGGSLQLTLDKTTRDNSSPVGYINPFPDTIDPSLTSTLYISATDKTYLPSGLTESNEIANQYAQKAYVNASQINTAGFDSISLKTDAQVTNGGLNSAIVFDGDVALTAGRQIILDSPNLQASNANTVTLNAAYVGLGSSLTRTNGSALLAPDAVAGAATLNVTAQGIDLIGGLGFNGFNQVNLNSSGDVRLRGIGSPNNKDFLGELNLAGNLDIKAQQVYPATLSNYTIYAGGDVSIERNPGAPSTIYSAGGVLTINANNIYQSGKLAAPFGELILTAADTLRLADGSLTSVSGAGAIIPFGLGSGGTEWLYPVSGGNIVVNADNLPQKSLQLQAKTIDLQKGANIDLSGGGNLYAYEFVTGVGGSNDVLDPTSTGYSQKFAVIPGYYNALGAYDPAQSPTSGLTVGESVYLNGGSGLAAGWYTLLPAHYALLPGAYLITPQAGTQDQFQTITNSAGIKVVSGYYGVAGTSIADNRTQGFAVQSGSLFTGSLSYNKSGNLVVNSNTKSPSQFTAYLADSFFSAQASQNGTVVPQLPEDAGTLGIIANANLTLAATLLAMPGVNGLGGQVDIGGTSLTVVGNSKDLASLGSNTVGLLSSQLTALKAPSLLLGGKRYKDSSGQHLIIETSDLTVASDVAGKANALSGQEILLAASNTLHIASGAEITATGTASDTSTGTVKLEDNNGTSSDGALLRVSTAGQLSVNRDLPLAGSGGVLTVEDAAVLSANGSMLLDSSQDTVFKGSININGGALALNSSSISIGAAPDNTPGLVLSDALLTSSGFNPSVLSLHSASDLNIYAGANLSGKDLTVDAAAINGFNAGETAKITASGTLTFTNTNSTSQQTGTGTGTLQLSGQNIVLGSGQYGITGFNTVDINADQAINGQGQIIDATTGVSSLASPGVLTVAGDVNLSAQLLSGGNGATTTINAGDHLLTINYNNKTVKDLPVGLGVSWTINAGSITSNALFDLPSGRLSLNAGQGDININSGSNIDLSGREVVYSTTSKYSPAGSLTLSAAQGNVEIAKNATVNLAGVVKTVSGAKQLLSNGGTLNVNTPNGQFGWDGSIDTLGGSTTTASGVSHGSFTLDVHDLNNTSYTTLNVVLNSAGFSAGQSLEIANGDISIDSGAVINAQQYVLNVDQGIVTINGTINATAASGGSVTVYGRNGITLGSSGKIDASSTTAGNTGGSVTLDTVHRDDNGTGLLDLSAKDGSKVGVINVSGGSGGSVHLRTGRDDSTDSVAVTAIYAKIIGANASHTALEATRIYDNVTNISSDNINTWLQDTSSFMNAKPVLTDNSGANLQILPGIEIRSSSDLTLSSVWDFMNGNWRYADSTGALSLPGFLTLRAADNLNINASISDGVATTQILGQDTGSLAQNVIQPGLSWSYHLVAGGTVNLAADYLGPDPSGHLHGNTTLTQVVVRTGTGSIDVQAGQDIVLNKDSSKKLTSSNNASAIYTFGTTELYTLTDLLAGTIPGLPAQQAGQSLESYISSLSQTQLNQVLRYGLFSQGTLGLSSYPYAEYPSNGGNISLTAGGNIQGQQTGQQITDWLVRSASSGSASGLQSTAWGINISGNLGTPSNITNIYPQGSRNFNQNVGALGGGNVTVTAGGDVNNLSVMIPTTGKPLGVISDVNTWTQTSTYVNGGGNLQVTAGHNIVSGEYYVANGSGSLTAGDSISQSPIAGSTNTIGVILDLGTSNFNLQARQDVDVATAMNPTVLKGSKSLEPEFFSYGDNSSLNIQAVAGNVAFLNSNSSIAALKKLGSASSAGFEYFVYPSTLKATALSGDIQIDNAMTLYPSVNGTLELLANRNIGMDTGLLTSQTVAVIMSDEDPALLPSILNPVTDLQTHATAYQKLINTSHASTLQYLNNPNKPLIMARLGDISFPTLANASFNLPEAANIIAGGNISDTSVYTQNLTTNDVTLVQAGKNISFDTSYDSNGSVMSNTQVIQVAGPGQLQVIAGGNINLGAATGIQTVGNVSNSALPSNGASIEVLAGLSSTIDYAGFVTKYQAVGAYLGQLQNLAGLTADQQKQQNTALTNSFQRIIQLKSLTSLDNAQQQELSGLLVQLAQTVNKLEVAANMTASQKTSVNQLLTSLLDDIVQMQLPEASTNQILATLFEEFKVSTFAAAIEPNKRAALYKFGTDAIDTLFPGSKYAGDVSLVFSQIETAAGGDINILTPGGKVDVGLAGTFSGISKTADQLGIVVADQGGLNILSNGNVNVNQSRVFSLGGGDITAWSTTGNIDAGKGAKAAISAPAPVTTVDPLTGTVTTTFPPVISGSGIQAIGGGNVYLAAPFGIIDAGEAGITGGQVVLAANAVVGAQNISSTVATIGVPTAVVVPVVGGADSAAASASKTATQSTMADNNNNNDESTKRKTASSLFSSDVIGYGKCSIADVREGKSGCGA